MLIHVFLDGGCNSGLKAPVFLPVSEGRSYLIYTLGLERAFILLCFAGRGWYVDLLCVDGWSIHRGLRPLLKRLLYPFVLFLIFISPVWVDLHFLDKQVKFMSPNFFLCIFSLFFNNIFMSI